MKNTILLSTFVVMIVAIAGCGKSAYDGKPGAKIGNVRSNPKDSAEMVWVPAGEFLMGSSDKDTAELLNVNPGLKKQALDNQKPQRKVYLDGYWIYKHEVTVAQYRKFCSETGHAISKLLGAGLNDKHPIVSVTWQDAADYAKWAGAFLPTEAQWEKAARGTDGRAYPWGNEWDETKYTANSSNVQPVGSKPAGASPFGCLDMAGSVWEWCADWYAQDYYKNAPARNPMGPSTGTNRVFRGGSCDLYANNLQMRCAYRSIQAPAGRFSLRGFRCAITQ